MTQSRSLFPTITLTTLLATLICAADLAGQVTFEFNFNDPANTGFNHNSLGQSRRDALSLAGSNFGKAFSAYNATIVVDVLGDDTGDTLMSAGSEYDDTRSAGFGNDEVVLNKVLNGNDLNGAAADASVSVNFQSTTWELNIDQTPSGGDFDWYSTAYHELAHTFGFSSGILTNNNGGNPDDGYPNYSGNTNGSWSKFDQFLTDANGSSVFNGSNLDEQRYTQLLRGGASPASGLYFDSPSLGQRVGLYSPSSFEQGSSGSHLDDDNPALAGSMMLAAAAPGPSERLFSATEMAIFRDIGYTQIGQIGGLPGDFDLDGDVDSADVDVYLGQIDLAVTDPAAKAQLDLDNDGTITLADHDQFISTLLPASNKVGTVVGDLNLDGDVDVSQLVFPGPTNVGDASILLGNLGTTNNATYAQGDLNSDGDVDVSQIVVVGGNVQNIGDASRLLANLGQTNTSASAATAAVPEPGSGFILAIGCSIVGLRRKR